MPKSHGNVKLYRHCGDRLAVMVMLKGPFGALAERQGALRAVWSVGGEAGCFKGRLERWRRGSML